MGIDVSDIPRLGEGARQQIAARLAVSEVERRKKYGNEKDTRGELSFDSRKEARRYDELMLLLKAGKIADLKLQPQFTLQESFITPDGKRVRAIRYVADFSYKRKITGAASCNLPEPSAEKWVPVVEDVKSTATRTAEYKMKRKLFCDKFGFDITEVI